MLFKVLKKHQGAKGETNKFPVVHPSEHQLSHHQAGNVVLRPELLGEFQAYAEKKTGTSKVPKSGRFFWYFFSFLVTSNLKAGSYKNCHKKFNAFVLDRYVESLKIERKHCEKQP